MRPMNFTYSSHLLQRRSEQYHYLFIANMKVSYLLRAQFESIKGSDSVSFLFWDISTSQKVTCCVLWVFVMQQSQDLFTHFISNMRTFWLFVGCCF